MRKILIIGIVAVSLLVLAGIVVAHGTMRNGNMQTYHEQMGEIMEEGTYNDLVDLRENLGFPIMPMIQNEEDFKAMQEMHESMEEMHNNNGMHEMMEKMHNSKAGMMGNNLKIGCH